MHPVGLKKDYEWRYERARHHHPPETIAEMFFSSGYKPVWKDFDRFLVVANLSATSPQITITASQIIGDSLRSRELNPGLVAVEHNDLALTPSESDHIQLATGDRLEIVRIVAEG